MPATPETPAVISGNKVDTQEKTVSRNKANPPNEANFGLDKTSRSPVTKDKAVVTENDLRARLESYYQTLRFRDVDEIETFYAPRVDRFFRLTHVSSEQILREIKQSWRRTPEDQHEIIWDTFKYYQDREGNYVVDYWMHYIYRRANKNWRKQKIYTHIKLNPQLQIIYIQGD